VEKVDWKWEAEKLLRRYKSLPAEIVSLQLQIRLAKLAGPSITPQYKLRVSSGNYSTTSSTENYVFSVEALQERLERAKINRTLIKNAIEEMTGEELFVYERRYRDGFSVKATMVELDQKIIDYRGISEASYYRLQDKILMKIALLCGIDVPEEEKPEAWRGELFVKEG